MKRAVVLAVLFSFTVVPVAYAQERRFTPKASFTFLPVGTPDAAPAPAPPSPERPKLVGKASIERAATAARAVTAPPVPRRNVIKKGWFWGLVGGAVLVILIWSAGGDD